MKKLLLVALMITGSLFAETGDSHGTNGASQSSPVNSTPAVSQEKNAKLFQYISACMVTRPAATDDIKALLK